MAIEKTIKINVDSSDADGGLIALQNQLKKTDKAVDNINNTSQDLIKTNKGVAGAFKESSVSVLENGGAMGILNTVTGGYAQIVKDSVESLGLFTAGSKIHTAATEVQTFVTNGATAATKALRASLVATGIGAVVLLITALVVAMSNLEDETMQAERAQRMFNLQIKNSEELLSSELDAIEFNTKAMTLRAQIAGKSETELRKIEKEASEDRFKAFKTEEQRLLALQSQRGLSVEASEKINEALRKNTANFNKEIQKIALDKLTQEKDNADKSRENEKKLIEEKTKLNDEARKLAEEKEAKRLEDLKIAREKELEDLIAFRTKMFQLESDLRFQDYDRKKQDLVDFNKFVSDEAEKEFKEKQDKIEKEKAWEESISNTKVSLANNTFNLLSALAKKGSALSKALAITEIVREQVKSVSATISATTIANAKAVAASPLTLGQPFVGLNTAASIVGIAASVAGAGAAIKNILSDSKSASGNFGGQSQESSAPSAPSFNLVQGTASNQIAQSLAQSNAPIKAYVVSTDMTTNQSLDRNILNNSRIG